MNIIPMLGAFMAASAEDNSFCKPYRKGYYPSTLSSKDKRKKKIRLKIAKESKRKNRRKK